MRILFCKCFGIGNAVMAVPAIKAIQSLTNVEVLDVLVGDTLDDFGAKEILGMGILTKGKVYVNQALEGPGIVPTPDYDLAILSIPFDGRWINHAHFHAGKVIDGRTRPDPSTTGLVSWKKHEIEYQMDNACDLGYNGAVPDCSFMQLPPKRANRVYIGTGYKKDVAGFWKIKHWGNDNFADLIECLSARGYDIIATGNMEDLATTLAPIKRKSRASRLKIEIPSSFYDSLKIVSESAFYVGNDTGMMHVAAAARNATIGIFMMGNDSIIKSRPWGIRTAAIDWSDPGDFDGVESIVNVMEII